MNKLTPLFLKEVLDNKRFEILDKLKYFKEDGFFLAGGTALALIYGHRTSIDFDFFINNDIDTNRLFLKCLEVFKDFKIQKTFEENNTLYIVVNDVKISFFGYKYAQINDYIKTDYFNIYSINDISAMKLWAIQNRATNKDYVDLYYIIKDIGLEKTLDNFFLKFGNIVTKSYLLKSLIYFDDIVSENLLLLDKNINFEKIKKSLITFVKKIN